MSSCDSPALAKGLLPLNDAQSVLAQRAEDYGNLTILKRLPCTLLLIEYWPRP